MRRSSLILVIILALGLAQLACNLPVAGLSEIGGTVTPTLPLLVTTTPGLPPVITATSAPGATQPVPSATPAQGNSGGACTYKVAFLGDVTIPDNATVPAGQAFVKTWQVRNDGTCTWGPSEHLHALAFTSGQQLSAPDEVPLAEKVAPGQSVNVSVNMTAPTNPGTYLGNWLFRVDGDPSGRHWVGIGSSGNEPLYVLIKVGSGSSTTGSPQLTRLNFNTGATALVITGSIKAGETKGYQVAAQKDQFILAMLDAAADGARLKVTTPSGTALNGSTSQDGKSAMVSLPATQDYVIWVTGGDQATNFTLSLTIPSRITFEAGATSASRQGTISNHLPVSYVLRAQAGQTLTAALTGSNVGLTIYGLQDGQSLVSREGGATNFSQQLTKTQDYLINVVPAVDSTSFTLNVTVK